MSGQLPYNSKRGKIPAKRASFKTQIKPYSPPANKVGSPTGSSGGVLNKDFKSAASAAILPDGNSSGVNMASPRSHARAQTYATRNNKISQLQAHDGHLLNDFDPNNSVGSNGSGSGKNVKFADNNNNLGSISENNVDKTSSNTTGSSLKQGSGKLGRLTKSGASAKSSKHVPSQSIAVMNQAQSIVKLEEFRNGLRDVIWNQANVMDGKAGYRMYIWKHMAKNVWLPIDTPQKFRYENYVSQELESDDTRGGGSSQITRGGGLRSKTNKRTHSHSRQKSDGFDDENVDLDGTIVNSEYITFEKLSMYLKRRETYAHFIEDPNTVVFMDPFEGQMKNVLSAYAVANHNRFSLVGVVQLCAVILTTTKKESDTFYLLQILTLIMREYYANDEEAIKNETLLLVDILCANDQALVNVLKSCNVDVIDLSMITCTWVRCLFSQHFLLPFVKRVIDLVLLEGPSVLTAIVYGIICLMKQDLQQCISDDDVFNLLLSRDLKNYLKSGQFINQVILKAQLLYAKSNNKFIISNRNIKSWSEMIKLPGKKYFRLKSGVGDERRTKKELKSVSKTNDPLFDKNVNSNGVGLNDGTRTYEDSDTDSDIEAESGLKRKLKDAEKEIAGLKGAIERFQSMHLDASQLMLNNNSNHSLAQIAGGSAVAPGTHAGFPSFGGSQTMFRGSSLGLGAPGAPGTGHTMPLRGQNSVEYHEDGANGVGASQIEEDGISGRARTDPSGLMNGIGTNPNADGNNVNFSALSAMQDEQQRMLNSMHEQDSINSNYMGGYGGPRSIAELLYMSPDGNEVYIEPIFDDPNGGIPSGLHPSVMNDNNSKTGDNKTNDDGDGNNNGGTPNGSNGGVNGIKNGVNPGDYAREIQCRTEQWTEGWKQALSTLDDVSITMQGYLCKMTASKWNTRGTFEKVQRRWFVLRGHYLTYFKTHHSQQPKGDKCISILGYIINPIKHAKSKYAFEVISPPKETRYGKGQYDREKFIILPDFDKNDASYHKRERNKWIKALRLASKGVSLWDPLLSLNSGVGVASSGTIIGSHGSHSGMSQMSMSGMSGMSNASMTGVHVLSNNNNSRKVNSDITQMVRGNSGNGQASSSNHMHHHHDNNNNNNNSNKRNHHHNSNTVNTMNNNNSNNNNNNGNGNNIGHHGHGSARQGSYPHSVRKHSHGKSGKGQY